MTLQDKFERLKEELTKELELLNEKATEIEIKEAGQSPFFGEGGSPPLGKTNEYRKAYNDFSEIFNEWKNHCSQILQKESLSSFEKEVIDTGYSDLLNKIKAYTKETQDGE